MGSLGAFLVALASPILKRALTSIGIGIVSYAAISTTLNSALTAAKNSWSGLPSNVLGMIQLAGIPTALSIIAGALIARVALTQLQRLEVLR